VADLSGIISKIPGGGVTRTQGIMVSTNGVLGVNVWGNVLPARYADPLVVNVGDTVVVDLMAGPTGQSEAVVSGKLTAAPRPGTGTVATVPPSSPTITVTGTDGIGYTAYFVGSYTPTVNDNVILAWNAATPTVTGKVGATAAPPPPVPPPAPAPQPVASGTNTYACTDSDTYWSGGGWGSWAGGGSRVYQGGGSYGGPVSGAWFYAGSPSELAGRTITAIYFQFGSRLAVGASNTAVTAHLYFHTNVTKPGGDVTRVSGPFDVTIPAGAGQVAASITPTNYGDFTTAANALTSGGGISINGESYAGFQGRNQEPGSGLLSIAWNR
jgi:hypothetical protein